jgi:hypothetical protein
MHVFYISYIYKSVTSSHAKPGLFETTSLTLLLTGSWIFSFRKSSCAVTSELVLQQIPEFRRLPIFVVSQVHDFGSLRVRDFEASQVRDSRPSHVRDFVASQVQDYRPSHVRDFGASQVRDSRPSHVRDFGASQVRDSRSSHVRDFRAHRFKISDLRKFDVPENSFHEFHKPRCFEGDRFSWIPQH